MPSILEKSSRKKKYPLDFFFFLTVVKINGASMDPSRANMDAAPMPPFLATVGKSSPE